MERLLIYYSLTGNGGMVASRFNEAGYDLRKVTTKHGMPKSLFGKMMLGGMLAGMHAKAKLRGYDPDVSAYDEIVLLFPIWNGRFPPVLNSVLAQTDLTGKKVSFVFCAGGGEGPKAEQRVHKLFGDVKVIFLKEPKKYPDELQKLDEILPKEEELTLRN